MSWSHLQMAAEVIRTVLIFGAGTIAGWGSGKRGCRPPEVIEYGVEFNPDGGEKEKFKTIMAAIHQHGCYQSHGFGDASVANSFLFILFFFFSPISDLVGRMRRIKFYAIKTIEAIQISCFISSGANSETKKRRPAIDLKRIIASGIFIMYQVVFATSKQSTTI